MTCARSLTCSRPPDVDPLPGERLDLLQERRRMNHDAVADDAVDPRPKDAGRDERELVRHPVGDDRMPGVGPPLIAHDGVMPVAEPVDDLPLGLVAPLQAHHASRRHGVLSLRSSRFEWQTNQGIAPRERRQSGDGGFTRLPIVAAALQFAYSAEAATARTMSWGNRAGTAAETRNRRPVDVRMAGPKGGVARDGS